MTDNDRSTAWNDIVSMLSEEFGSRFEIIELQERQNYLTSIWNYRLKVKINGVLFFASHPTILQVIQRIKIDYNAYFSCEQEYATELVVL